MKSEHDASGGRPKAKEWVAETGYGPVFGARPLTRFLQRNVETKLARALIAGELVGDSAIVVTVQDDELMPIQEVAAAKKY